MRQIALLGSTGSIGTSTLEVIAQNREEFQLTGIAAGENIQLLEKQVREFSPDIIAVKQKSDAESLRRTFPGKQIVYGSEGLLEVINYPGVDTMVSAVNGTTTLEATLASIKNNHRICLANKETMVAAGELINQALTRSEAEIIPVDSEQSAIFQCLKQQAAAPYSRSARRRSFGASSQKFAEKAKLHKVLEKEPPGRRRQIEHIKRVILTASGGPFAGKNKNEFSKITVKQALAHPTWAMGTKITIDSATLMNKALEIIEAFYLFHLEKGQIDVIIHPQSIIHSMVEFVDSSIIAQLSVPDMRIPILYSLSYPRRMPFPNQSLNFSDIKKLEFFAVDRDKFSSVQMAYHALEQGKNAGAVLNAANEVAVEYFLQEKISFKDIFSVVEHIFYNETFYPLHSIEDVKETIAQTKQKTYNYVKENVIN
ncbi:MAG: 1-deoxy-D-xylulose-5-phosphate reductoisomerase [Candidatus Aminicenantes bacterium]|jgi:1-deoxy-D-xylulose-5-phosphate reductoisomerase